MKALKRNLLIHSLLFWAAAAIALASALISSSAGRMAVALCAGGLLILSIVWQLLFVKCPFCGSPLPGSRTLPRRCPECGRKLSTKRGSACE